ncbi:MAG TPA: permease-like cell division protein FtsX [Thermoclostridium sp.]|nr:permease-like cell division protein FtsX [Thermoclostridium sp.]
MKIRTMKYMVKEGFVNTYKNLLMTIASVSMVVASLLIFGIFLMVTINLSYNLNRLKAQTEIVVFLKTDIAAMEADDIELKIKSDERVSSYVRLSKEQAFAQLATTYIEDSEIIDGLTPEFLNESFRIHLNNADEISEFTEELGSMNGIEEINYPLESLNKLSAFMHWVNVGCMVILSLLLIISVSIIANTIKLTVYARRREIGIMKYIGANDWFIRGPFVIEGMIIGFAGAVLSFVLTSYLYNAVASFVNTNAAEYGINELVKMVTLRSIGGQIFLIYAIIGMVMGLIGSIISVRKYLNV